VVPFIRDNSLFISLFTHPCWLIVVSYFLIWGGLFQFADLDQAMAKAIKVIGIASGTKPSVAIGRSAREEELMARVAMLESQLEEINKRNGARH